MTTHELDDMQTPIGSVLGQAGEEGLILELSGERSFAVLPLDDDVLDFLMERSPEFIEECRRIRERMRAGDRVSHSAVRKMFSTDPR